ncbi:MAG TPA: alpha/beta fold hydrolase [Novosphingobium sp.]|nr:alpha/beta fold hydrolase [Novosphingobium sp.]
MARFILVHGAWHGGWCWEEIVPRLEAAGHEALAPDLPGMGADADSGHVASLEEWAMFIAGAAAAGGGAGRQPAILVGHSRGGMVISRAAQLAPVGSVAHLAYLAAAMPRPGQTMSELFDAAALSRMVDMTGAIARSADGRQLIFHDAATALRAFYGLCPAGKGEAAFARLTPEPAGIRTARVELDAARYGQVARSYIRCERDMAVVPELQNRMIAAQPCPVFSIDTDHSPFYSAPDALAQILCDIAGS